MNAALRAGLFVLSILPVASAVEPQVRVAASRELRVAVIDSSKRSEAREAMHQAFAATLGASLTQQCGGHVGVKAASVGADHAAFNLGTGVYDAVLVVGRSVPDVLRRVDGITLQAIPESGRRDRALYLVIANGDASLQRFLEMAFSHVVKDQKFLEQFAGADAKLTIVGGPRIAAIAR